MTSLIAILLAAVRRRKAVDGDADVFVVEWLFEPSQNRLPGTGPVSKVTSHRSRLEARLLLVAATSCLLGLACGTVPNGTPVDDPELAAVLRPEEPISEERLSKTGDDIYYYAALEQSPAGDLRTRYLALLARRGVSIRSDLTSPHVPLSRATAYGVTIVQEANLKPYTIRYRLAWMDALARRSAFLPALPTAPVRVSSDEVVVRLGADILRPWTTAVVVPEQSTVQLPFALPLPENALVVDASRRTAANGRASPSRGEADDLLNVTVEFLSPLESRQVAAFFKKQLQSFARVPIMAEDLELYVKFGSRLPRWIPQGATGIKVDLQNILFSSRDGVSVWDARYARFAPTAEVGLNFQPGSLRNLPSTIHRYRVIIYFY